MKKVVTFFQNHWEKIVALIAVILLVISVVVFVCAKKSGEVAGDALAVGMGKAVGSAEGFAFGLNEGYEKGKEEGLSAKDTIVEIKGRMTSVSNLQVYICQTEYYNHFKKANLLGEYNELFVEKVDIVYYVNLDESSCKFSEFDNKIEILIPEPEIRVTRNGTESIAEYKKGFLNGNAEDSRIAYDNSCAEIEKKIEADFSDEEYMEKAKTSAIKKVTEIAESVNASDKTVVVDFIKEEKGDE